MPARCDDERVRLAGKERDGRRAGRGDQVQRAEVVADGQRRAGAERGDLHQVGAAGEVASPRRLALDRVGQIRLVERADDDDVVAAILHPLGELAEQLDRPTQLGPVAFGGESLAAEHATFSNRRADIGRRTCQRFPKRLRCRSAADASLRTLIDKYAQFVAYEIADIYALRGEANEIFYWLDRALSNGDTSIEFLLFDPFILRYKDDPRFAAFCRKVGLPVPGEASAHKSD